MKQPRLQSCAATVALAAVLGLACTTTKAQVLLSGGTYSQNFDTLAMPGGNTNWTDNSTLPGWYAGRAVGGAITVYRTEAGTANTGALYSFGSTNSSDRALGSLASGTPKAFSYGLRLLNDTASAQTNFTISYTGEQWRNSKATADTLAFFYRVDGTAITDPDPNTNSSWTPFPALNFVTPTIGGAGVGIDGNATANRTSFTNIVLTGVALQPGQEMFLRWHDIDDASSDHAFGIDDFTISFTAAAAGTTPPSIVTAPTNTTVGAGNSATFSVSAGGTQPFTYQWYMTNGGSSFSIDGATSSSFTTNYLSTNLSGSGFFVIVNNNYGSATSSVAVLTVTNVLPVVTNISYLHTLHNGNYALTDSTTLYQVEGIVTTKGNLVTGGTPVYSFFIQDATGGMDVFNRGGWGAVPEQGQRVRVTGPLDQFNGLLEMHPVFENPTHNIEVLNGGAIEPLPAPVYFDFTTTIPAATMEHTWEGRYIVISNVYLGLASGDASIIPGHTNVMTNLTGQVFKWITPTPVLSDPAGQSLANPAFATSIKGVMSQSFSGTVLTTNYMLELSLYSDIQWGTPPEPTVSLSVSRNGSSVEIAWPTSATGYSLEGTATLGSGWGAVGQSPTVSGSSNIVTINNPTGVQFYRLTKP